MLPTVKIGSHDVTRLICGGNPFSGFSHMDADMDRDMVNFYTMPQLQATLDECWRCGINTFQSRGDRHQTRMYLEHQLAGGQMQWIAQTASEFRSIEANIAEIARYKPIAIYHHGSHTDNSWHTGRIDDVADIVKCIKDKGIAAGLGTHIPEVVTYAEDKGWETDFYMCCFYNLARGYKSAPAAEQDAYARDKFAPGDPDQMARVMRAVAKPCIGFKIMAASRNCSTPDQVRETFVQALERIKPIDIVDVGMFQKYKNQVAENAQFVRQVLGQAQG